MRVPWRFSFGPLNGDMLLGDVGDIRNDAVNLIKKGLHYGAGIVEGNCAPGEAKDFLIPRDSRTGETRKWISPP